MIRNLLALIVLVGLAVPPALAAPDDRPYDERLFRLSEVLGAVHYLRELCGANDGQAWRDEMQSLIDSEGTSAFRKAKLAASFNKGYRSYRRTYQSCTKSAETAIERFLDEGAMLADEIVTPPGKGEAKAAAKAAAKSVSNP